MQPRLKELTFGEKLRKLYSSKFYLPGEVQDMLCSELQDIFRRRKSFGEEHAIRTIDEQGEWLY